MIMIIISSLIIISFLVFALKRKPMVITGILIVIFIGILIYGLTYNLSPFIKMRQVVYQIAHWIAPPEDLFQPILVDKFLFHEKGFTKTYHLKPKYFGDYYLGFLVGGEGITKKYKFKGKLKVEFFYKDKFLFDDVTTIWVSAAYSKNAMAYFSEVDLYRFYMPLEGKYAKDISVKITVLEPDEDLKKLNDLITLFIKVAPSK